MNKNFLVAVAIFSIAQISFGQDRVTRTEIGTRTKKDSRVVIPSLGANKDRIDRKVFNGGRTAVSGVGVQVYRSRNPLQLVNPFAPASYSDGSRNFVPSVMERRLNRQGDDKESQGLKLFQFEF
ncbi:MAG: hypothetical protein SGI71_09400 [Verrucomicrobiota bacterium]|nr:hypothetical protein [Verrucomicrobiota bacterium]